MLLLISEDKAKAPCSRDQSEGRTTPLSAEKVKDAAKAGLSAAAMKAKLFADHEEREIQRLCANIINHQVHNCYFLTSSVSVDIYFIFFLSTSI